MADQYQIDLDKANAALKEMMATTKFLTTSVKDLTSQISGMAQTTKKEVDGANKPIGEYAKNIEKSAIPDLKQWRQEQRLQNFVIREGTQLVTSFTLALAFLQQGQGMLETTTKQVSTSILAGVAAMNGIEFAAFSLGQVGQQTKGKLGELMTTISEFGGPIAIGVGALVGLISYLDQILDKSAIIDELAKRRLASSIGVLSKDQLLEVKNQLLQQKAELEKKVPMGGAMGLLGRIITSTGWGAGQQIAQFQQLKEVSDKLKLVEDELGKREDIGVATAKQTAKKFTEQDWIKTEGMIDEREKAREALFTGHQLRQQKQDEIHQAKMDKEADKQFGQDQKRLADLAKEVAYYGQMEAAVSQVGNALSGLGIKQDSFLSKLISGIELYMQYLAQIDKLESLKPGESSMPGQIGIIGTILKAIGLFDSGGFTGPGSRYQPAGIVHKGEFVFEKPIVDRMRPELELIRAIAQRSYAAGGAVSSSGPSAGSIGKAVVAALSGAGAEKMIKVEVHNHYHNPVTFREAFKVETSFNLKKNQG